jgi:hypothetical protein
MSTQKKINRRKFVKVSAITAAAGVSVLAINFGIQSTIGNIKTKNLKFDPKDTKDQFKKCGACSHLFLHLLNREFGYINQEMEYASDPLAGGMMKGYQCGMLWGSSLAVGTESYRRYSDINMAMASTIKITGMLMESFVKRTESVNCSDVSPVDFTRKGGMAKFMLNMALQGGLKNTACFDLAENWAPEAIQVATRGFSEAPNTPSECLSCASEVVQKMGGTKEEISTVAGLAGGMGLKGHACGALGAAIWMCALTWCKQHPGEKAAMTNNENTARLFEAFNKETNSEILCRQIAGKSFVTIDDHTAYIKNGGCQKLIDTLAAVGMA